MNIWLTFFGLQLLDVFTTIWGLSVGAQELNPTAKVSMCYFGIAGWVGLRLVFCLLLIASGYLLQIKTKRVNMKRLMSRVNFCFALLVFWNAFWLGSIIWPLR